MLTLPFLGPSKAVNCEWGEWDAWHLNGNEKETNCICSGKKNWLLCEKILRDYLLLRRS